VTALEHLTQVMLTDHYVVKNAASVLRQLCCRQLANVYRLGRAVNFAINFYALADEKLCQKVEVVEEVWFMIRSLFFNISLVKVL